MKSDVHILDLWRVSQFLRCPLSKYSISLSSCPPYLQSYILVFQIFLFCFVLPALKWRPGWVASCLGCSLDVILSWNALHQTNQFIVFKLSLTQILGSWIEHRNSLPEYNMSDFYSNSSGVLSLMNQAFTIYIPTGLVFRASSCLVYLTPLTEVLAFCTLLSHKLVWKLRSSWSVVVTRSHHFLWYRCLVLAIHCLRVRNAPGCILSIILSTCSSHPNSFVLPPGSLKSSNTLKTIHSNFSETEME